MIKTGLISFTFAYEINEETNTYKFKEITEGTNIVQNDGELSEEQCKEIYESMFYMLLNNKSE